MKSFKRFALFTVVLFLSISLFAVDVSSFDNSGLSSISNPAYYGRFKDLFANPAALALSEEGGNIRTSLSISEDYDISAFSEAVGYIQNQVSNVDISLYNKNIAMTVKIGTSYTDRVFQSTGEFPHFDIYSNIDLELTVAYAFPYISVGGYLKGGNSMARMDKEISGFVSSIANSYLSPFERITDSERFSVGLGILSYFENYSFGVLLDDVFTISDGEVKADFTSIYEGLSLSFAAYMNKFTETGDLRLFRPRASLFYGDFNSDTSSGTFMLSGDIELQLLPDKSITLGVGYLEKDHKVLRFNRKNGELGLYLRGEFATWEVSLGASIDTGTFNRLKPQISASYIM